MTDNSCHESREQNIGLKHAVSSLNTTAQVITIEQHGQQLVEAMRMQNLQALHQAELLVRL